MVALKLHAARSPSRSDPGKDWTDIRPLIKRHGLWIRPIASSRPSWFATEGMKPSKG